MLEVIKAIIVPASISFVVSVWYSKKVFGKVVEIMSKMDKDQQKANQDIRGMILKEIQRLRNFRETNFTESGSKR